MNDETVTTEQPAKVKAPKTPPMDTVINCNRALGYITGMDGKRYGPGESVKLPEAVCEALVLKGVARYPAKSDR